MALALVPRAGRVNDHELTTQDAAELLKISVSEIRALCRTGVLRCSRVRGRWYLSRSAVAAYLRDRLAQIEPGTPTDSAGNEEAD